MASGIKGQEKPGGGLPNFGTAPLFTATATTTLILSCCNQAAAADTINIALIPGSVSTGTSSNPSSNPITASMYIERDFSLNANTSFERTGIVMESGARLIVGSTNGSVSFVAYGLES